MRLDRQQQSPIDVADESRDVVEVSTDEELQLSVDLHSPRAPPLGNTLPVLEETSAGLASMPPPIADDQPAIFASLDQGFTDDMLTIDPQLLDSNHQPVSKTIYPSLSCTIGTSLSDQLQRVVGDTNPPHFDVLGLAAVTTGHQDASMLVLGDPFDESFPVDDFWGFGVEPQAPGKTY